MEIVTNRTRLIKYRATDFAAFCEVICNDEVMLHISGKGHSKEVAREKFNSLLITNRENKYYGIYKVCLRNSNKVVGFAKVVPYESDKIELGYALLPAYWRQGFTLEMMENMIAHCREFLAYKKIMAIVNLENIASLKVLEKLQFKPYKNEDYKGSKCVFLECKSNLMVN